MARKGPRVRRTRFRTRGGIRKRRTFRRQPRYNRAVKRRRGSRRYVRRIYDQHYEYYTTVLDNSASEKETTFLVAPTTYPRYRQSDIVTPGDPNAAWSAWVSRTTCVKLLGQLVAPGIYAAPQYGQIRLDRVHQYYTPTITNITSVPETATTGQLAHSMDNVKMEFVPGMEWKNWTNWAVRSNATQVSGMEGQKTLSLDSRRTKTVKMNWKNKDPMTRGRYIQSHILQQLADNVYGDVNNNFWDFNQDNSPVATNPGVGMPLPFTDQWYQDAAAQWVDYCLQPTAATTNSKALYTLGMFSHFNPKYSIKRAGFLINVPPKMSCRFVCPITTKTVWSGIDYFEQPVVVTPAV